MNIWQKIIQFLTLSTQEQTFTEKEKEEIADEHVKAEILLDQLEGGEYDEKI